MATSSARTRENVITDTFVELSGALTGDFDLIELLTILSSRSSEVLGAAAAGILLVDPFEHLRVMAASTEDIELLELFQVQNEEGPCLDSFRSGSIVASERLGDETRWPLFTPECLRLDYRAVVAIPLRFGDRRLGCLNTFMNHPMTLSELDAALAQAFADVATITIIQDEARRAANVREANLQHALESRIAIEQAKGMISQAAGVTMDEAFTRLRNAARANNHRLTELALSVADGRTSPHAFPPVPPPTSRRTR